MNCVKSLRPLIGSAVGGVLLYCFALGGYGQQAVERYIPIGRSPGLSGSYTYTGKIRDVDNRTRALEVREHGNRYAVHITADTRIWLDRSKYRRPNLVGTFNDCRKGRRVEIKFTDAQRDTAEWVKIESR